MVSCQNLITVVLNKVLQNEIRFSNIQEKLMSQFYNPTEMVFREIES